MSKLTQKELITEGFLDTVRALGAATKQVFKTVMPGTAQVIGDIRDKAMAVKGAYTKQIPLSVLKDTLKKRTDIEFIELINQEQRTANPKKPWYREIHGPKNVTLITFTANVYTKGSVRDYKMYKEAVGKSSPKPLRKAPIKPLPKAPTKPLPKAPTKPQIDTLTAEVFRTSEGLVVGEIYSTKTGRIYWSKKEKSLPIFDSAVVKYKDPTTGEYTVKNLIAFLHREIGLSNSSAKNIHPTATNLAHLISLTTGVQKNNLTAVVPDASLSKLKAVLYPIYVENNNITRDREQLSQINLIKQLNLLNDSYNKTYELSKYKDY